MLWTSKLQVQSIGRVSGLDNVTREVTLTNDKGSVVPVTLTLRYSPKTAPDLHRLQVGSQVTIDVKVPDDFPGNAPRDFPEA